MERETYTVTKQYARHAIKEVMNDIIGSNDVSKQVASVDVKDGECYVNEKMLRVTDYEVTVVYEE
jgi:hypothetical protein